MARILVVDLEESVRRTLCNLLRAEGHEAVEAGDAEEALQLLSKGAFDVVVTDINLPRTSGVALLQRIRASHPLMQVVMMTEVPTMESPIASLRDGAADYLVKSVSKDALLRSVSAAIRSAIRIETGDKGSPGTEAGKRANLEDLERLVDERTEALQDSEERYRALFDRSLDCVFLTDFEGHFLDANPAVLDLLGYRREDLATVTFASLLTPDQLPLAMQVLEEVRSIGTQKTPTEFRLRRKDGDFLLVETRSSLIYRHGKPYAVQGLARDITERKRIMEALQERTAVLASTNEDLRKQIEERQRSEAALKQSQQRYRTLVDTSPDAIILLDPQARILTATSLVRKVREVLDAAD